MPGNFKAKIGSNPSLAYHPATTNEIGPYMEL